MHAVLEIKCIQKVDSLAFSIIMDDRMGYRIHKNFVKLERFKILLI